MNTNLQLRGFKVYKWLVDGRQETVASGVDMKQAANIFWNCSNNFTAKSGVTVRVMIVDQLEIAQLLWEYGRGYTFNGKLFQDRPIIEDEPVWH